MRPLPTVVAVLPLALLFACGGPPDADYDGFADKDDCDPDDALVYPGAPDLPADGIDSDCDGEDPALPFVGEWTVVEFNALYSTFDAFAPGSTTGTMSIDDEGVAVLDAEGQLDEELIGLPVGVIMTFDGHASETPERGGVALYLAGIVDAAIEKEESELELQCAVIDEVMTCEGTVKALGTTLATNATFEPL